jgi:peptidoglycan/xylan/chitin deacetylase (PgdA/CDA1 family)
MYHRVAQVDHDPWRLAVTPAHFEEHLAVLQARFRPTSLRELSAALEDGAVHERSVVVTFDDGYRDNVVVAKPLLERYEVPATVFVVSSYVDSERDFWWDELAELSQCSHLPELEDERNTRDQLARVSHSRRLRMLDELWQRAELRRPPATRVSTRDEIRALATSEMIEVGGHTATHPRLPELSPEVQREEIESGKAALERLLGRPVESFSYPHGAFDRETTELVGQAGFRRACAGTLGGVKADTPVLAIPRLHIEDMPGHAFTSLLDRLFA